MQEIIEVVKGLSEDEAKIVKVFAPGVNAREVFSKPDTGRQMESFFDDIIDGIGGN